MDADKGDDSLAYALEQQMKRKQEEAARAAEAARMMVSPPATMNAALRAQEKAYARRLWQALIDYGPDGGFWYAGSRQVVPARAYNDILDVNEEDYDMHQAYERAGMILNPIDADWCNGARWDRPHDWGNPTARTFEYLDRFETAWENNNIGPADDQILWMNQRMNFFIVTRGQVETLCGNQSCVWPSQRFPP